MRTWRQLSPAEQQEARDWWETSEEVYAGMSDFKKLQTLFIETPMPSPWPQPPVDLRGVKADELPEHDYCSVLVPDSVYEILEGVEVGAPFTDEADDAVLKEVSRFTGIPPVLSKGDRRHRFRVVFTVHGIAEVLLSLDE